MRRFSSACGGSQRTQALIDPDGAGVELPRRRAQRGGNAACGGCQRPQGAHSTQTAQGGDARRPRLRRATRKSVDPVAQAMLAAARPRRRRVPGGSGDEPLSDATETQAALNMTATG